MGRRTRVDDDDDDELKSCPPALAVRTFSPAFPPAMDVFAKALSVSEEDTPAVAATNTVAPSQVSLDDCIERSDDTESGDLLMEPTTANVFETSHEVLPTQHTSIAVT